MKSIKLIGASSSVLALSSLVPTTQAASFEVAFQATIASEQHPTYAGEARYYHVSVNPNNPGVGSYAATIVGSNNPAPTFVRPFTEPVIAYAWIGGTNNVPSVNVSGGTASLITYATPDTAFDGFAQQQLKLWTTTDPGADLQTTIAAPFNVVADVNNGGHRSFGGAVGTVDITGLGAGSVWVFYGAFNTTPTVSAVMRDTDGPAPDITITDDHLNGDLANRTEYYVAELKFVNDAGYDKIEYTHLANGVDYAGNGRGLGTVLTGLTGPPPIAIPFAITSFEFTLSAVPMVPSTVSLTWTSKPGVRYAVRYTSDLASWPGEFDDSATSDPDSATTTRSYPFDAAMVAPNGQFFVRVERVP